MTLQLNLPAALEQRLRHEAQRRGLSLDAVTLHLLDEHLPGPDRPNAAVRTFVACPEDEVVAVKIPLDKPLTLLDPDAEILGSFES
jgi:hypothetical protein